MFKGLSVALVTPFQNNKKVDYTALGRLIDSMVAAKVQGLVPCGCTGEAATLSLEEQKEVIQFTVNRVQGTGLFVVAGTGSNSTKESVQLTQYAKEVGADGAMLITPYYNKPTQKGLYQHYATIASQVDIPIMLYNVPGRTAVHLAVDTILQLAQDYKNIVAIKEASGSPDITAQLLSRNVQCTVLSGDDMLAQSLMVLGAQGVVSVAGNIIPEQMAKIVSLNLQKEYTQATEIFLKYYHLFKGLFIKTNPIPIKMMLHEVGLIENEFREPLCKEDIESQIKEYCNNYNLGQK